MGQQWRDDIIKPARAGYPPATIIRLLKYNKKTMYTVFNKWKVDGDVTRKAHAPRSNKKCTPRFVAGLKWSTQSTPVMPLSVLTKKQLVSHSTISRAVWMDLGLKSFKLGPRHILMEKMKVTRVANRMAKAMTMLQPHRDKKVDGWDPHSCPSNSPDLNPMDYF